MLNLSRTTVARANSDVSVRRVLERIEVENGRLADRALSTHVDDARRLVDRHADLVTVDGGNDSDTERIIGDDFSLVIRHEVEEPPRTSQVVGLDSRRNAVVIVEGDDRRVEQREAF